MSWLGKFELYLGLYIEVTVIFQLPGIRLAKYSELWEKYGTESKMVHK